MQGKGWGKKMMNEVDKALIARGSPGMHLRVSHVNFRALGFYDKLGYPEIMKRGNEVIVGKRYL
jgi:ribosomal protein S18 acetylase RimI-like enzyme